MKLSFLSLCLPFLLASNLAGHVAAQSVAYVQQVANVGGEVITDIQNAGEGSGRLFVVTRDGRIRIVRFPDGGADDGTPDSATVDSTPFVNIASRITNSGERGLLGLAFHSSFAANG
mmetsp:Transcript_12038/g.25978  ORF Transcript_12038/g.25978 Transcript_12038/m.25978 type:complete len:117 (+) Transcript_12038:1-351(+)